MDKKNKHCMDYISYEFGIMKELRCMLCGIVIGNQNRHNKFRYLANFKKRPINIKLHGRESYLNLLVCPDCFTADFDKEEIIKVLKRGWKEDLIATRKFKKDSDAENHVEKFYADLEIE